MNAVPVWRHGETGFLSVGIRDGKGGWEGQQLVGPAGLLWGEPGKALLTQRPKGAGWPVANSVPACDCARAPRPT